MSKVLEDHVWAILVAFIATLGCFTAVSLVGGDGKLLEQVVVLLGGALAGYATAKSEVHLRASDDSAEADSKGPPAK